MERPAPPSPPQLPVRPGASSQCGQSAGRISCQELGCSGHALGALAQVADKQGAAPPGVRWVQLQKREKRGPQWKQWRAKYLIFLGGVDRSSGSPVRCGDWGQPPECIWIWARTNLLQITWQSLENLAKQ